jgi:hypothetical protein
LLLPPGGVPSQARRWAVLASPPAANPVPEREETMSRKYTVTAFAGLALPAQTPIRLTDAQLALRQHQVRPAEGARGWFVSDQELTFKAGEAIDVKADLPASLAVLTDAPPPPPAEPTPAPGQGLEDPAAPDNAG